jgi:hypothetical protein
MYSFTACYTYLGLHLGSVSADDAPILAAGLDSQPFAKFYHDEKY